MHIAPRYIALVFPISLAFAVCAPAQMTAAPSDDFRGAFSKISREEIGFLLEDLTPVVRKKVTTQPILFNSQLNDLRELFIYAQQAVREGMADEQEIADELDWIALEQQAFSYDRELSKRSKRKTEPLAWVTAARIRIFLAKPDMEDQVEGFVNDKLRLLRRLGEAMPDDVLTEDAQIELREHFARVNLAAETARVRSKALGPAYQRKVAFKTRLQQAQLLAKIYAGENVLGADEVLDDDVEAYVKQHPDLDKRAGKRAKAEEVLRRVLAGEDIAKLAAEFSDDPGSKAHGGLYRGVKPGVFLPAFEEAAAALEPGEVSKDLVETDYGYHIIKLEKRGTAKDEDGEDVETFDVRHILFATTVDDPDSADGEPRPLIEWVKDKITSDREATRLAELTKKNPVLIEWP